MKVKEIFESRTNFDPETKKDLERMNRKRFGHEDAKSHDMKAGRGSDVMRQLTRRDPASKSNSRRGISGISGKDRMRKIKKIVPGEM
jgi:hypothetical protein